MIGIGGTTRTNENPLETLEKAMRNAMPQIEVRGRRVGGATYQVPIEVRADRRIALGIRWLIFNARTRGGRSMHEKLAAEFPGVHIIAGLSNISHGMPARKLLNQAMTVLALGKGLDAGIIDPNDRYLMALIYATEALLGRDEFCMNYISKSREGAFEGI